MTYPRYSSQIIRELYPQKKFLSNSHFFYFEIKIFFHFQGKFAKMTIFNKIFGPLIKLKSVIFRKISPPGPGSRRKIHFKQQRFLELYPYLYPVQIPNYFGAVPGTGRKNLRYVKKNPELEFLYFFVSEFEVKVHLIKLFLVFRIINATFEVLSNEQYFHVIYFSLF